MCSLEDLNNERSALKERHKIQKQFCVACDYDANNIVCVLGPFGAEHNHSQRYTTRLLQLLTIDLADITGWLNYYYTCAAPARMDNYFRRKQCDKSNNFAARISTALSAKMALALCAKQQLFPLCDFSRRIILEFYSFV